MAFQGYFSFFNYPLSMQKSWLKISIRYWNLAQGDIKQLPNKWRIEKMPPKNDRKSSRDITFRPISAALESTLKKLQKKDESLELYGNSKEEEQLGKVTLFQCRMFQKGNTLMSVFIMTGFIKWSTFYWVQKGTNLQKALSGKMQKGSQVSSQFIAVFWQIMFSYKYPPVESTTFFISSQRFGWQFEPEQGSNEIFRYLKTYEPNCPCMVKLQLLKQAQLYIQLASQQSPNSELKADQSFF